MRWSTLPTFVLVAAIAMAAPVPKTKEALPPFPMTVGDTREYEWRDGDKSEPGHTDTVTLVVKQKDGSTHVTVRRSSPKGDPYNTVIGITETALSLISE